MRYRGKILSAFQAIDPIVFLIFKNAPVLFFQAACRLANSQLTTMWFEPVAPEKSVRGVPFLSLLQYASPNMNELRAMALELARLKPDHNHCKRRQREAYKDDVHPRVGKVYAFLQQACPLLQIVLDAGLQHIVLTLGALGAALCRLSEDKAQIVIVHGSALSARVNNCSGAGDCLVAGFLDGLLHGVSPEKALAWGLASAKLAVESSSNVPLQLSSAQIQALASDVSLRTFYLERICCCQSCCSCVAGVP